MVDALSWRQTHKSTTTLTSDFIGYYIVSSLASLVGPRGRSSIVEREGPGHRQRNDLQYNSLVDCLGSHSNSLLLSNFIALSRLVLSGHGNYTRNVWTELYLSFGSILQLASKHGDRWLVFIFDLSTRFSDRRASRWLPNRQSKGLSLQQEMLLAVLDVLSVSIISDVRYKS